MTRRRRRFKNFLDKEIRQGIEEYEADRREQKCRRKHGRLVDILKGERVPGGIYLRCSLPHRPEIARIVVSVRPANHMPGLPS